jgi:hypothetical protein
MLAGPDERRSLEQGALADANGKSWRQAKRPSAAHIRTFPC